LCTEISGAIGFTLTSGGSSQLAVVPATALEKLDSIQLEMAEDPDDDVETASDRRQYQSRGVTAGASSVTASVAVAESMLTLVLQLFRRFSRAGVYRLSLLAGATQSGVAESRVGDAEFFIRRLLDRACADSVECADVITALGQQPATADESTLPTDAQREDKDERQDFGFILDIVL